MTTNVLFVGGEDLDFTYKGAQLSYSGSGFIFEDTTAGRFRAGIARYGIQVGQNGLNGAFGGGSANQFAIMGQMVLPESNTPTSATDFWLTARCWNNNGSLNVAWPIRLRDINGVERLRWTNGADSFKVYTVNAAGTAVSLGNGVSGFNLISPGAPDRVDMHVNYATSGRITIWVNGAQVYDFSGDITTNGQTALSTVELSVNASAQGGGGIAAITVWSEVMMSKVDTRACPGIVSHVATANGNTHNFDSGTASNLANVNMTVGDAAPNYSATAGQIQEYQVTPAIPSGSFGVDSVVHKIRGVLGNVGPTKINDMVRTGGTDYASSDIALNGGLMTYMGTWDLNPNTGLAWSISDLVNSSTAYNFGLKSVA